MANKNKESRGRAITLLGLLAGAAVGGAVALVYAPSNGEQNRKRLNQWAHRRLDDAQHKVEQGIS